MKLPLFPLAAALLLFSACGRSGPGLGEAAVRELGELQLACTSVEDEMTQEYLELFARVQATGDVAQASTPHRITLLHLAALHKKHELVRDLLRAGADPNARQLVPAVAAGVDTMREGDPVLGWALAPQGIEGEPAATLIPLIDMLLEAGADVRALDAQGLPLLVIATFNMHPTAEEVFLHLLAQGAATEGRPANELARCYPLGYWVANRCWTRAMAALLDKGCAPTGMLPTLASHAGLPAALDGARLLLERGAAPGECLGDGTPALYEAASALTALLKDDLADEESRELARQMVVLLLKAGANPLQACGALAELPGACAADLLREDAALPARLAEAGLAPLPPLALELSGEGETFLCQICRASRLADKLGIEALQAHVNCFAALLETPSEAMHQSLIFPAATAAALRVLTRLDAPRAAHLLVAHPCWKDSDWGEEGSLKSVLLGAVQSAPQLVLPETFLQEQATGCEASGHDALAASFIELLARDAAAAPTIERLCADNRLALRVGARTARLLQAGLPGPRTGSVANWMNEHQLRFEDAPPTVQTACLATALEEIWMGRPSPERREAILTALRAIGANEAADFYENPTADAPENMDLRLEEQTAKYLWEHRADFHAAAPSAQTQEKS